MSAPTVDLPRPPEGAWRTVVRGIKLSPELRIGLPASLVLALIATAGRAIVPIAVQRTVDVGLGGTGGGVDLGAIVQIVALAGLAVLVTAVASGWMNYRLAAVVESALSTLRVGAFRHIHDLSMLHQASQQRGSLVARVTSDVDEISRFMQWAGLNLITASGQLTVATIVMFVYSWRLTLIVLAVFVPFVIGARWFQRRLTVAYRIVRERVGDLLGVVAETVVGAPVVRAYGVEARSQRRLDQAIEDHRRAAVRAGALSSMFSGTGEVFGALATAAAVLAGVLLGIDGEVTPGTVLAFLFLITLFVDPVLIAAEVINEGQTAVAGWRRVLDVLDLEPDVADPGDNGRPLPEGPLGVRFEAVGFRYPKPGESARTASGPFVLHDVEVELPAQRRIAVVGETGSGKTTFAKLLTRLMDPTLGRVCIAGVGHVGLEVEHVEHPPPARNRGLALVDDLGGDQHRVDEQRDEEQEGEHGARRHLAVDAEQHPGEHGRGGRQRAEQLAGARERRGQRPGAHRRPAVVLDGLVEAALAAVLDAVGTHHGGADDRLGHHPEQITDPFAHDAVGDGQPALEPPRAEHERHEHREHDQRQAPGVDEHHDRGHGELARGGDQVQPGPLHEAADLVDVAGDPGDQRATLLARLVQHRQVVDVAERPHPQRRQRRLDHGRQAVVHPAAGHGRDQHRDPGQRDDLHDGTEIDAASGPAEPEIDGPLHRDRDDRPPGGRDQREHEGGGQPDAQLGRELDATHDGAPGPLGRPGKVDGRGAHGPPSGAGRS